MKLSMLLLCFAGFSIAKAQTPSLFVLNAKTLKTNKAGINNKDAGLLPSYKQLLKDAEKALKEGPFSVMEKKNNPPSGDKHDYMSLAPYYWPDPSKPNGLPYIRKDGQTNPEVKEYKDKEYMPKLCEMVHTLSLAYYFSDNHVYAQHAAKLLKVWFLDPATKMNPNLNYGQAMKGHNEGRGAGLIDTRHFIKLVDAISLLETSKHWKKEDQEDMKQWFAQFLNWMQTSPIGLDEMDAPNNHGIWYDAQRLSFALFIDSIDLSRKIVASAQKRLESQMDEEGKFPREMERTIALHYSVFAMDAFLLVASLSEKIGIDFWNYKTPSGKSLKKGFEFLRPYLTQEKEWPGQQIKDFDFEEGFNILLSGYRKFGCKKCADAVKQLAGDKAERLRIYLLN